VKTLISFKLNTHWQIAGFRISLGFNGFPGKYSVTIPLQNVANGAAPIPSLLNKMAVSNSFCLQLIKLNPFSISFL
jgi:hypothetical protein